jgi:methyl acetate hydrolase
MPRSAIDLALTEAANATEVPGVVAMAADANGIIYEGAFGARRLGGGADGQPGAMTLDTVFRIASMTKAVTCVAAMQLVERGKLSLDGPLPDIDEALSAPLVLTGFDAAGRPQLRPAKRPITLKHLLSHTAGFSYPMWNPDVGRYLTATGTPAMMTGKRAALRQPLVFDPGDKWEYGINIDWVGRLVEAVSGQKLDAYFAEQLTGPLGMRDTGFAPTAEQRQRQAVLHQREADGSLTPLPFEELTEREFFAGGGGLYSTAGDYLAFLRMLLHGGTLKGQKILSAETVALMAENHIGDLPAGIMKTAMPELSNDAVFFPGNRVRWGLGYMLTLNPGPDGRSAGSVAWGGLFNSYYWLDPEKQVAGLILTQILPWIDPEVMALYGAFERGVYAAIGRE